MAREIEIKLRVTDFDALRRRLSSAGARRTATEHESNTLFDTPGAALRRAGCGLRIRIARAAHPSSSERCILTFKGPVEAGAMKSREELETTVADGAALRTIVERLGYGERVSYEKVRESWQLNECEVALDELPVLGRFVEIEGPGEDAIRRVMSALELDGAEVVRDSYPAMAERAGRSAAQGRAE